MYQERRKDIIIARIEGSINEEIAGRYGINSFPVVALFSPNEEHISAVFQGHRVVDVLSRWVEANAPQIRIENATTVASQAKIEEKIIDPKSLMGYVNKTEVTNELDAIKGEIQELKNRIETLSQEINEYKSQRNASEVKELKPEGEIALLKVVTERYFIFFEPSLFNITLVACVAMIIIASLLTIKGLLTSKPSPSISLSRKICED